MQAVGEPASSGQGPGPVVAVEGLERRYGDRVVVDNVSLAVQRGTIFALLGPNGAGKTTTIETIEGYQAPSEGRVRVFGLDPRRDRRQLAVRMGVMLQGGSLYPQSTPAELLDLFGRFFVNPVPSTTLLELLDLGSVARTRYRALSGGERQRLSLGLALVGRPELLILDEPTAGMDPAARASTRSLISSLRREGRTILLTTHDLADVEQLADEVVILHHGWILAQGTVAELTNGGTPTARLRLAEQLTDSDRADLGTALSSTGQAVRVELGAGARAYRLEGGQPTPVMLRRLAEWCAGRGIGVEEWRIGHHSLEERYLELTGDRAAIEARDGDPAEIDRAADGDEAAVGGAG
jgi:ABC-2 type transport system ATP-binding protein